MRRGRGAGRHAGDGDDGAGRPRAAPGREPANLDPADFVAAIDNPYWPMAPGSSWVYRETDGEGGVQRVEVTVTPKTKTILGIKATVVHDIVTEEGKVDRGHLRLVRPGPRGNVWYLGEDTKEYDGTKVSTKGSWEAGVDGAEAGVVVPAAPEVGLAYRQEYYAGEAEDAGRGPQRRRARRGPVRGLRRARS